MDSSLVPFLCKGLQVIVFVKGAHHLSFDNGGKNIMNLGGEIEEVLIDAFYVTEN